MMEDVDTPPRWVEPPPSQPLDLHAWAEAGYLVPVGDSAEARGAYLSLARLQGQLHESDFDAFLQVGADHGDLDLLDARISWRPTDRVVLRAGRFKAPVSAEYLIPAPRLLFVHRSLHMALVPKRSLGAEAEVHLGPESADVALSAGIFDPADYALVPGSGELVTARALLHTGSGFGAHLAGAAWIHDDTAADALPYEAPDYERHLVAALLFEEHGVTAVVEGALATMGDEAAAGGVASVGYRFPVGHKELSLEPATALEVLNVAGHTETVGQVALNVHPHDWNLVQTLEWEVQPNQARPSHLLYVQLQAGL